MNEKDFETEFIELFGFLMSQEIAKAAPKDTGKLSKSFPGTFELDNKKITWNVPFYWEFIEYGTIKMLPNPFVRTTIETKKEEIAEKVLDILSKR